MSGERGEAARVCDTWLPGPSQLWHPFSSQAASTCRGVWPCVSRFWKPCSTASGPPPSCPHPLSPSAEARNKSDPAPPVCVHFCGPRGRVQLLPTLPALPAFAVASKAPPLQRPLALGALTEYSLEVDPVAAHFRCRRLVAAHPFRHRHRPPRELGPSPSPGPYRSCGASEWPLSARVHDPQGPTSSTAVMNIRNARVR